MTWTLANTATALGSGVLALSVPALLFPDGCRRGILAFPRSEWAGWLLTALALTWTSLIVLHAPLQRFESLKPALYILGPAAFLLIVIYLDELLAPRALGGVILLLANPVLKSARWHPSSLRLIVTTLTYLAIVAGVVLVLSPYRFRTFTAYWVEDGNRCRVGAAIAAFLGGLLVLLGLRVY